MPKVDKADSDTTTCPPAGRWMRQCPVCERLLRKEDPWDRIACECGWEWR